MVLSLVELGLLLLVLVLPCEACVSNIFVPARVSRAAVVIAAVIVLVVVVVVATAGNAAGAAISVVGAGITAMGNGGGGGGSGCGDGSVSITAGYRGGVVVVNAAAVATVKASN